LDYDSAKGTSLKEIKIDLLIIGAGPAGLGAALYAARSALEFKIVDKLMAGGQITTTEIIENYPGFKDNISGYDLMATIIEHCKKFNISTEEYISLGTIELLVQNGAAESGTRENGAVQNGTLETGTNFKRPDHPAEKNGKFSLKMPENKKKSLNPQELSNVYSAGDYKFVCTGEEVKVISKAAIIATGTSPERLYVEGESEYIGKGISYCATCDGALYWDKEVLVIGGGNTAIQEALFLTKFAKKVYVVHRRSELRAVKILQDRAFDNEKIEFIWDSVIEKFSGSERLEEVTIKNVKSGKNSARKIAGVFEYVGIKPNSAIAAGLVDLDTNKFIITDSKMRTSQPGLFAAGDVRNTPLRQVITAVADGAVAATYADKYINDMI
jgi:thioredoxin reductase (NADPH)